MIIKLGIMSMGGNFRIFFKPNQMNLHHIILFHPIKTSIFIA